MATLENYRPHVLEIGEAIEEDLYSVDWLSEGCPRGAFNLFSVTDSLHLIPAPPDRGQGAGSLAFRLARFAQSIYWGSGYGRTEAQSSSSRRGTGEFGFG